MPAVASFRIDTECQGALVCSCARARSVEGGKGAFGEADEAVKHIAGVLELSRDHAQLVDAVRHGALVEASAKARSGGIEGNHVAVGSAHEAVR